MELKAVWSWFWGEMLRRRACLGLRDRASAGWHGQATKAGSWRAGFLGFGKVARAYGFFVEDLLQWDEVGVGLAWCKYGILRDLNGQ